MIIQTGTRSIADLIEEALLLGDLPGWDNTTIDNNLSLTKKQVRHADVYKQRFDFYVFTALTWCVVPRGNARISIDRVQSARETPQT